MNGWNCNWEASWERNEGSRRKRGWLGGNRGGSALDPLGRLGGSSKGPSKS